MKNLLLITCCAMLSMNLSGQSVTKEFRIEKQYLNIPVDMQQERQRVHFMVAGDTTMTYAVVRIADSQPDYWVFKDVSAWSGKKLTLAFSEKS